MKLGNSGATMAPLWLSLIFRALALTLPFTPGPVSCCIVAAVGEAAPLAAA